MADYWYGTFAIYNPRTEKIYFRKSLFKVDYKHEVLGAI